MPNEGGARYRGGDPGERPMSISGIGRQGKTNTAPTHFASTSEQRANAGAAPTTPTSTISYEYGNDRHVGNIFHPGENEKTDGNGKRYP